MAISEVYAATLAVDYPERPLDRLTTFFRVFTVIPIAIILGLVGGGSYGQAAVGGVIFVPTVLMLLFRQKYPRWWFDWNLALTQFSFRVTAYLSLLRDEYPSPKKSRRCT